MTGESKINVLLILHISMVVGLKLTSAQVVCGDYMPCSYFSIFYLQFKDIVRMVRINSVFKLPILNFQYFTKSETTFILPMEQDKSCIVID